MSVLAGIIIFHLLVIVRAKQPDGDKVPYLSVFILTCGLVGYVVYMMFTMKTPEP